MNKAQEGDWENVETTEKQREDKAFKEAFYVMCLWLCLMGQKKIIVGLLCVFCGTYSCKGCMSQAFSSEVSQSFELKAHFLNTPCPPYLNLSTLLYV